MKGKSWIVTAAAIVAGVRLWMQVRGKTKTPFDEWVVGWGALFMLLAILTETGAVGEQIAAGLSGTVVIGDILVNGADLFGDVSKAITGAQKGQPVLNPTPFAASVGGAAPPMARASSQPGYVNVSGHQISAGGLASPH